MPAFVAARALALLLLSAAATSAEPLRAIVAGQALIRHDLREHAPESIAQFAPIFRAADAVFTDVEVAIRPAVIRPAPEGRPYHGTYLHDADPVVFDCLRAYGFNLVALGNNHAWDRGPDGILAAIAGAEARGITHAGTGRNLNDAAKPGVVVTRHGKVALVAMAMGGLKSQAVAASDRPGVYELKLVDGQPDPVRGAEILATLREASRTADLVIAYTHDHYWGGDAKQTHAWKRAWARQCIEAGAHVFVSHGSPHLHGMEVYRGRPIFYGMGSFIFHSSSSYGPEAWETFLADIEVAGGTVTRVGLTPVLLSNASVGHESPRKGVPAVAAGADARRILERVAQLSRPFGSELTIEGDRAVVLLGGQAPR